MGEQREEGQRQREDRSHRGTEDVHRDGRVEGVGTRDVIKVWGIWVCIYKR